MICSTKDDEFLIDSFIWIVELFDKEELFIFVVILVVVLLKVVGCRARITCQTISNSEKICFPPCIGVEHTRTSAYWRKCGEQGSNSQLFYYDVVIGTQLSKTQNALEKETILIRVSLW